MAYSVNMAGAELAHKLAIELTDLEFELLVRARIKNHIATAHAYNTNLSESHDEASFTFSSSDKSLWSVGFGENYSKRARTEGEVLSATFLDAAAIMQAKERNKMSLLLTGPTDGIDAF